MQFLVIFFLFALAAGNAEECSEEKAEACVETLLSSILGDTTEEEVCKELRTSIDCLRNTVDECLQDETDDEIEEGLQELEKVHKDNCNKEENGDEDEEMQKCFEENEDYIYECIYEGSTQALTILIERGGELDENTLQCAMYGMMAGCFVNRIREKCGEEAAILAEREMKDLPVEIQEACAAAESIEAQPTFQLLDAKKRK